MNVASHCNACCRLEMASFFILFLVFQVASCDSRRDSVIDHLSNGMKFAKDFLGSESVAIKVADFVVRAFQAPTHKKQPNNEGYSTPHSLNINEYASEEINPSFSNIYEQPSPLSPWRHLIKLFGLQTNQISAVAVNALIFIAQMITTFLSGPKHPNRQNRSENLSAWVLNKNSKALQDLISTAKNESLPTILEDLIMGREPEETACIQLLVCKITPFVNKMQKAVFDKDSDAKERKEHIGSSVLYRHLPSEDDISSRSHVCEQRYKECDLNE